MDYFGLWRNLQYLVLQCVPYARDVHVGLSAQDCKLSVCCWHLTDINIRVTQFDQQAVCLERTCVQRGVSRPSALSVRAGKRVAAASDPVQGQGKSDPVECLSLLCDQLLPPTLDQAPLPQDLHEPYVASFEEKDIQVGWGVVRNETPNGVGS